MNRDSFEKALAATAKVACCSALIGVTACKPKPPPPASPAESPVSQPAETSSATPPAELVTSTVPAESEVLQPREPELPPPFPADFEDCESEIRTAIEGWKESQEVEASKEVKDCCERYIAHLDDIGSMDGEFRYDCCSLQNWSGGTRACTPWGPPMPPVMS